MKYLNRNRIQLVLEQMPVHLLLMPLFFVCYSWKSYHYFFDWSGGLRMGIAGVAGLIVLATVLYILLFKAKNKSGIAATAAGMIFFHYTALYYWLQHAHFTSLGRHRVLIPVLGMVWLLLLIRLYKQTNSRKLNAYLNVLFLVLIIFEAVQGLIALKTHQDWWARLQEKYTAGRPLPVLHPVSPAPDIYHIILDAHTSFASLEQYWGYSDTILRPFFQERDFFLATKSRSDYRFTVKSMSALFEMKLLDTTEVSPDFDHLILEGTVRKIIRSSLVPQLLRSEGYELINLSFFDLPGVDRCCESEWLSDPRQTFRELSRATLAGQLYRDFLNPRSYLINQAMIDSLVKTPQHPTPAPRFVYAHLTMPHAPYNFDREGTLYRFGTQGERSETEAYLEYLIYCDRLIKTTLQELMQQIRRPSVIIVQGDHGFQNLEEPAARDEEAFTILNAIWFSDGDYTLLHDSVSSVDTYPILLEKYFGVSPETTGN